MTDKPDKESRTEQATDKRLLDAREEGNVPHSREVANFTFLVAGTVTAIATSTIGVQNVTETLAVYLTGISAIRLETNGDVLLLVMALAQKIALVIGPIMLLFTLAGVSAAIMQNPPTLVWKRIMPDFSRVSPAKGFKRLIALSGLLEFAKTTFRFWLMAVAAIWAMYIDWDVFIGSMLYSPDAILFAWLKTTLTVLAMLLGISSALLVFDWPLAHILWRRNLMMSPEEIKQERKQIEGDALIKARRRSIARARTRRRMIRDVSKATVVIANPTHFSIALRYVREEGGAPKVVAKGQDLIALAIRRRAEEHGIPIVEDKALARSLYSKVEIDQMIPVEFYRAIAEILIRLQGGQRRSAPQRA